MGRTSPKNLIAITVAMASPQLLWECVKNNSSFLRKNPNMPVMTAEPANLCGINSFKFSGLANKKVLGLSPVIKGKKETIIMTTSHQKNSRCRRPASLCIKTGVNKNATKGLKQLRKAICDKYYWRDLVDLAEEKYKKIKTSFKKKKITVKSRRNK